MQNYPLWQKVSEDAEQEEVLDDCIIIRKRKSLCAYLIQPFDYDPNSTGTSCHSFLINAQSVEMVY